MKNLVSKPGIFHLLLVRDLAIDHLPEFRIVQTSPPEIENAKTPYFYGLTKISNAFGAEKILHSRDAAEGLYQGYWGVTPPW